MFRYGIILGWLFFILLIGIAAIFSYNETIKAPVMLTSMEPPAQIRSKRTGRLIEIIPSPQDTVKRGELLGVLEHTGNTAAILGLLDRLNMDHPVTGSLEELSSQYPWELEVGDHIRPYYNRFLNAYHELLVYRTLDPETFLGRELRDRRFRNASAIQNKKQEIKASKRDLELSGIDYERHRQLHKKGVISARELEMKEIVHLNAQGRSSILEDQLGQLGLELSATRNDQMILANSRHRNEIAHLSTLESERENLLSVLAQWKDQYLLESPIDGRISLNGIWGDYQNVMEDQIVFTVVPIGKLEYLGLCQMPVRNSGKVRPGQRVILKLENYPYREWGSLEGKVGTISEVPGPGDQGGYMVFIEIANLTTSFKKTLDFRQEMRGTAEIILDEVTLLQRVFYQFRELWSPSAP